MERASNVGIQNSDSKYLVIHDDDDSWEPGFLEETVAYLENLPSGSPCGGVVTHITEITEELKGQSVKQVGKRPHNPGLHFVSFFNVGIINQFLPIAFVYYRRVLDDIGPYDESLPVVGDWEFNLRFLKKYDIDVIPKPLANYHLRVAGSSDAPSSLTAQRKDHLIYDAKIRTRMLREDMEKNQAGLGLYLNLVAALVQQRKAEDRLRRIENSKAWLMWRTVMGKLAALLEGLGLKKRD
jgi:glycosyltransferase involved in cell wall biosynthesis